MWSSRINLLGLSLLLAGKDIVCQLRIYSPDDQSHAVPLLRVGFEISNVTSLKFSVKACADAHLIIQKDPVVDFKTVGNYVYVMGSYFNSRVGLSDYLHTGNRMHHLETVLNCNEYRPFWVSWSGGNLTMGKGEELGTDGMLSKYVGPLTGYRYVFLLTGWGSHGCWHFDIGNSTIYYPMTKLLDNKQLQGNSVQSIKQRTKAGCANKCVSSASTLPCGCQQFSYNRKTGECLIVDASDTVTLVDVNGWGTWTLN